MTNLSTLSNVLVFNNMAERVGFEPTLPFRVNTLSKRAPSATRPSLRCFNALQTDPSNLLPRLEGLCFHVMSSLSESGNTS